MLMATVVPHATHSSQKRSSLFPWFLGLLMFSAGLLIGNHTHRQATSRSLMPGSVRSERVHVLLAPLPDSTSRQERAETSCYKENRHLLQTTGTTADPVAVKLVNTHFTAMVNSTPLAHMVKQELDEFLDNMNATVAHDVAVDRVMFIVRVKCESRTHVMLGSYLRWAKNVLLVAETANKELGWQALPAERLSLQYEPDQSFVFLYLRYQWEKHPELYNYDYYVLVDDDTWVNVPFLLKFLRPYSPSLNLMFSHVQVSQDKNEGKSLYRLTRDGLAWGALGPGVIMTKAAMLSVAGKLLTLRCPWISKGADSTLFRCAAANGVMLVHTDDLDGHDQGLDERPLPYQGLLTVHGVARDCNNTFKHERTVMARRWCCSVSARYNFSHHRSECDAESFHDPGYTGSMHHDMRRV